MRQRQGLNYENGQGGAGKAGQVQETHLEGSSGCCPGALPPLPQEVCGAELWALGEDLCLGECVENDH